MARTPTPTVRRPARPPQRRPEKNLLNYPRAGARGPLRWWPSLRLVVFLVALGILAAVAALAVAYRLTSIPEPNAESGYATSSVYYADGTTKMADFNATGINRVVVPADQISQSVKDAIIASEDKTFYENRGISLTGIGRAAVGVVTGEDRGGGSTITQQYVKNVYLTNEVTYTRKAKEALIALKIDQTYSKDEILTNYLNTIYFGRGAYGIQAAAQVYYGKNAIDLTDPEAALLVGIVPAPSAWDPLNDPEQAQSRYAYVVNSMVDTGALTRDEALAAPQMPATLALQENQAYGGPGGYILQAVRDELVAKGMTEDDVDTGGYKIVTTVDLPKQLAAEESMQDQDVFPSEDVVGTVQGGLISIDPATGGVVAMYGGRNYLERQTDAILDARAQAGSTFKPFTLIAALEQGHALSETFNGNSGIYIDGYEDGSGRSLPVDNFGDSSFGRINLLTATANSVNTVYVALNEEVGPEATQQVAQTAIGSTPGVSPSEIGANLGNVLGTASVHPVEMAGAYATIAAEGVKRETHFVASVTAATGEARYVADTTGSQAFDAAVMANTTYALEGVVQNGSASWAKRLGRPAAGKTGSTSDNKAAWFSGFTPQLETTVVFFNSSDGSDGKSAVGDELSLPRVSGREFTGGSWPTRIWTAYMEKALEGTEELDFPAPTSQARGGSTSTSTATSSPSSSRSETSTAAPSTTSEETAEPEETTAEPTPSATATPSEEAPSPAEPTAEAAPPAAAAGAAVQPAPGGGGNGGGPAGANGNGGGGNGGSGGNGAGNGNGAGAGNGNGG